MQIGRITLFDHDKQGRVGAPDLSGRIITDAGELLVEVWIENANTKTGRIFRGRVIDNSQEKQNGKDNNTK